MRNSIKTMVMAFSLIALFASATIQAQTSLTGENHKQNF